MDNGFLDTLAWRRVRAQVLARDRNACAVGHLLGGECGGALHVHHYKTRAERPDLALDMDNLITVCARCHPRLEALRRFVERSTRELPQCPHVHPTRAGREACDRRRAARLGIVLEHAA